MNGQNFWNRLKAGWYRRGLDYSSFPKTAVPIITSRAAGARTFLDVGCGCGTLSIPLAKAGKKVTALDSSTAMMEILKADVKKAGLGGRITPVEADWADVAGGKVKLKPHDAVLCANVPALLKAAGAFVGQVGPLAGKYVFIIENADPKADKFYYRELYPLLFGRPFEERTDYFKTYSALHAMGIFANVEVIEYDFDQPFTGLDEAVEFWKEYLGIVTEEHDAKLRGFLSEKLVRGRGKDRSLLLAKFHKKAAVIWWKTGGASRQRG